MRAGALLLILLAPLAVGSDPSVILVQDTEGVFLAPTTPFVPSPFAHSFAFDAPECYRTLLLDLRYDPDEAALDVEGVGEAAIAYEFRAEVWREGARVLESRVDRSGYGFPIGGLEAAGGHTLRLSLGWGAAVDYTVRLRGVLLPGCEPTA